MKKINWTPIKEMLFTYLAINKIMYWIDVIFSADGFYGVGMAVTERLLQRDIVLISLIIFMYFFEYKFVMKQKKWNGAFAMIILSLAGYVVYCVILFTYWGIMHWVRSAHFDVVEALTHMPLLTAIFFTVMAAMIAKEQLEKKHGLKPVSDSQSVKIKLEMLDELLDDGAISQEECEKQKGKILC